jgi:hypothetical protein
MGSLENAMSGSAPLALRAAALAGLLLTATVSGLSAQEKVGINSAVNSNAIGNPPGAQPRRLIIGENVVFNEHISTDNVGQTQLLFLDESSMTIGPNSDLTIDQFVYDPKSGTGKLAMSATRGLLRYVGGKLSKQDEAVTLRTSTATLAVRGGAFILYITGNGATQAIFIYGKGLSITGNAGGRVTLIRPGYQSTTNPGGPPGPAGPEPAGDLAQLLARLDGRSGGNGGAPVIPTDTAVVNSGVPQTISGDLNQSVLQSTQNQGTTSPPPRLLTYNSVIYPNSAPVPIPAPLAPGSTNTGAGQVIDCISTATCIPSDTVQVGVTTSGQPVGGSNSITPTPPLPPTPPPPQPPSPPAPPPPPPITTVTYAGRLKNTNGNGTAQGFVQQTPNGDIAYSGGTLSFPVGSPQNGVFTGTFGSLGTITFPLVPGTASIGPQGTMSGFGTFSGTTFLSADGTFFSATIVPTAQPGQRLFVFGGLPVNPGFYQPTGAGLRPQAGSNTRIFAFTVQPDAALQSNIPFIRAQAGGNLPNATVSPLYVVAPPTTPIGSATTLSAARALQASLAINGTQGNQQSVISVTAGTIASQSNGQPILLGQMRGSSLLSAGGTPVGISSAASSTVDGNGNSFYGGSAISGFVVDQTAYASGANGTVGNPIIPSPASETPLLGSATTYGFAQAAVPTAVPAGAGASRTTQALSGSFGGLMYTTAQTNPYIVTGNTIISTDAPNNRIQANLTGSAQSASAGVNAMTMQYGGLTGTATGQAFVDDNTFAATENQAVSPRSSGYFASSGAAGVPTALLQQSGATACQCQYLKWGYWGGDVPMTSIDSTFTRVDSGHINTWVAGVPTPLGDLTTLNRQSATANYAGHLLGSVFNNGQSYVAAGGFTGAYNFGRQTGSITGTFDTHPFTASGAIPVSPAGYTFGIASPALTGTLHGNFYGPMAAETGGNFAVHSVAGLPTYLGSGIFAGAKTP